jgi:hypothetical protein
MLAGGDPSLKCPLAAWGEIAGFDVFLAFSNDSLPENDLPGKRRMYSEPQQATACESHRAAETLMALTAATLARKTDHVH